MERADEYSLGLRILIDVGWILFGPLLRLRVEGREHVPRRGGAVVVCNHPSMLDPMVVPLALQRPSLQLSFRDTWRHPEFAFFLDHFGCLPVDPGESAVGAVREAVKRVQAGALLIVFAEGGFSRPGQARRFQHGAAGIALEAECPVIPAAVCGSYQAWPAGATGFRLHPVAVHFGRPMEFRRFYGQRPSTRVLRGVTEELEHAVARLMAAGNA
ncbi:MAG: 1-acyl-sn-glycerol-3-phosphate acyltransferase [Armatimonadetes bacterium]|nr:1-acyl-sn-glycerol-3-phosphate acyltransferase [Armatimonadota bacterium]